ncbi:MAG: hypothetical protein LAT62_06255 [Natronospirillum sp.]|uniref:hypothetical protein n=1 Tax=Natronospirillum sp. TaxID=2812955 RepID=UPI0025D3EF96|nr:hypothetical protein [Natronospirillum sp.]MCH8551518.1 hypothetical protein [Natronospirillum sp.]
MRWMQHCRTSLYALAVLALWLPAVTAQAQSFSVIQTQYFNIIHQDVHRPLARHLASVADAEYEQLLNQLDMIVAPRVDLLIDSSYGDSYNATATIASKPMVTISPSSHLTGELLNDGDAVTLVLRHELAHILTSRKTSEPEFYRFGYVAGNNTFVPLAFHEGYAQWFESDRELLTGRAFRQHPLFEGLWLQEYQQGFRNYTQVFETGRHESVLMGYLYGAYFFTHLSERFGDDVVRDWVENRTGRHGFWADLISPLYMDIAWRAAFDESLAESWAEFLVFEQARLETHLADDDLQTPTEQLAGLSRFRHARAVWHEQGWRVYRQDDGLRRPALVIQSPDGETRRHRGYQPEQITASADQGVLWFNQLERCSGEPRYSLYRLSLEEGGPERIARCSRVARLAWHGPSEQLATWEQTLTGSQLVLRDAAGEYSSTLLQGDFGVQIKALTWHPDGERLLLTMKPEVQGNFDLYELTLDTLSLQPLTRDAELPEGAHWADQDTLVFSVPEISPAGVRLLQAHAWQPGQGERQRLTRVAGNVHQPRLREGQVVYLTEGGLNYDLMRVAPLPDTPDSMMPQPPVTADWVMPAGLILGPPIEEEDDPETDTAEEADAEREPREPGLHPYYAIEYMSPGLFAPFPYWDGELGFGLAGDWREPTDRHQVMLTATLGVFTGDIAGTLDYRFYNDWSLGVGQARQSGDLYSGYRAGWDRTLWQSHRGAFGAHAEWVTDQRHAGSDNSGLRRRWAGTGVGYGFSQRSAERYYPNRSGSLALDYERAFSYADSNRLRLTGQARQALWGQHSVQAHTRLLWTDDNNRPFSAGRSDAYSVFSRPIGSTVTLRALPEPLDSPELLWARPQTQWLLAEPDRTLGSWGLGINTLWLTPYAAGAWDLDQQARYNIGAELELHFTTFWLLPLEAAVGYAHNPEREEIGEVYFNLGPRF